MPQKDLTPRESQVFYMLKREFSAKEICQRLQITPANFHNQCHRIRKKTGIVNLRNREECKAYTPTPPAEKAKTQPTPTQMRVLRLVASGTPYASIAAHLGMHPQTAQNHASQGCQRLGITGQGIHRTAAIKRYLAAMDAPPVGMDDPYF